MRVLNKELLDKFMKKHADSVNAIGRVVDILEKERILNLNELRLLFPTADYIGRSRYVLNIKGNDYRLLVTISFVSGIAYVLFIGTHAEYDKIDCLKI
ncbi:toxin RelE [Bacteroidia bacterium]|nr:toxin RelE [Bacteroidia bacterium]